MFYRYTQNRSGGFFIVDEQAGIGPLVWVEAASAREADDRAKTIGIYFNGCDSGEDCECCGDRWEPAWEGDSQDEIHVDVSRDFTCHDRVYFHLSDGSILRLGMNSVLRDMPCRA